MKLSKLNVVERQLGTAIELLLAQGDKVSIHTLVSASLTVARDLAKAKGTQKHYQFESMIHPSAKKAFRDGLVKAANFFKHADRDPFALLEDLDPSLNEYLVWWTLQLFVDLGGKLTPQMEVFTAWMIVQQGIVDPENVSQFFPFNKICLGELFKACQDLSREESFAVLNLVLQAKFKRIGRCNSISNTPSVGQSR